MDNNACTFLPFAFAFVSKNTWKLRYPSILWKLYQSLKCYILCFLCKSEIIEMWFFRQLLIGDMHVRGDAWK